MRTPNQRFEFELARSSSVETIFTLRITDRASRMQILEAELNAEQFADLLSNRIPVEGVPVWFTPAGDRDRIGKQKVSVECTLSYGEAIDLTTLTEWANQITRFVLDGATTEGPRVRGGGNGYRVRFTRFFETATEAVEWQNSAAATLQALPSPAQLRKNASHISETSQADEAFKNYQNARAHAYVTGSVGATYDGVVFAKAQDTHSPADCDRDAETGLAAENCSRCREAFSNRSRPTTNGQQ